MAWSSLNKISSSLRDKPVLVKVIFAVASMAAAKLCEPRVVVLTDASDFSTVAGVGTSSAGRVAGVLLCPWPDAELSLGGTMLAATSTPSNSGLSCTKHFQQVVQYMSPGVRLKVETSSISCCMCCIRPSSGDPTQSFPVVHPGCPFAVTVLTVLAVATLLRSKGAGFTCCELCTFALSGFGTWPVGIARFESAPGKQTQKEGQEHNACSHHK